MKKPYIFYPIIIMWLLICSVEVFMAFDGFDRVRTKLRGNRKTSTSRRKRED